MSSEHSNEKFIKEVEAELEASLADEQAALDAFKESLEGEAPDYTEKEKSFMVASDQLNTLVIEPKDKIQLRDHEGKLLINAPYTLELDGVLLDGVTDVHGSTKAFDSEGVAKGVLRVVDSVYEIEFSDEDGDDVHSNQARLNALGYDSGPLDGIVGRRTEDAILSFQRQEGLAQTGEFDDLTVDRLKALQVGG